jgi:hypothetical protein
MKFWVNAWLTKSPTVEVILEGGLPSLIYLPCLVQAIIYQIPKKVPFANSSNILVIPVDYRNGGISVASHFLQSLTERKVIIEVCNILFRYK